MSIQRIKLCPPPIPPVLPDTPPPALPVPEDAKSKRKSKSKVALPPTPFLAPSGLPPDKYEMEKFFVQSKELRELINRLNKYHSDLGTSYKEFILATNEKDQQKIEQFIEDIMRFANKMSLDTKAKLEVLKTDNERIERIADKGSGDIRMRLLHYESLVRQFAASMKDFQEVQRSFQERRRDKLIQTYLIVRPYATQEELDRLVDSTGNIVLTSADILRLGEKGDLKQHLDELKRRRQSVLNIEAGIKLLNQMFIDMQTMVDEQGEILNSIEQSLENVEDFIAEAADTLDEAVTLQKAIRKKRCNII